jgi:hypothetical protein
MGVTYHHRPEHKWLFPTMAAIPAAALEPLELQSHQSRVAKSL